jgi:hypothetical protein
MFLSFIQCSIQKVFKPLDFTTLKSSSIYTQYPLMTKQKQVLRNVIEKIKQYINQNILFT